jgi:GNAT superfamily N-acetyltransferase
MFAAQLEAPSEAMFLAEEKESPVGMLRCVESIASPLLLPERYCYVSSAYVRPSYRRRGVLHDLFECAVGWCRERGLTEMRLHNVGTRADSVSAWDSLGFDVVEQVRVLRLPVL